MRGPCVLVVDDSIDVLQTLSDILAAIGHTVRAAPSAERALQILEGTEVDLVITDLRMGRMGGMALIRRLQDSFPTIPVIAISGFADARTVIQAFREGAVDFITKPFTVDEVAEAATRALACRRAGPARPPAESAPPAPALSPDQRARAAEALRDLQTRLDAELALLIGPGGTLLAAHGRLPEEATQEMARAVGRIEDALDRLTPLLGEPGWTGQTWEGERWALYGSRLAPGFHLLILVPRSIKPGLVTLELREARARLQELGLEAPRVSPPGEGSPTPAPEPLLLPQEETWEVEETGAEELLTYEEALARGLIPDLGEERENAE
jgi:FixJ family two-component response regulator